MRNAIQLDALARVQYLHPTHIAGAVIVHDERRSQLLGACYLGLREVHVQRVRTAMVPMWNAPSRSTVVSRAAPRPRPGSEGGVRRRL